MELRRSTSSHSHYIQAIKKGSIVKTLNVGKFGRPGLVYRSLKDIYECIDADNAHLPPVCPPKDEFRGNFSESCKDEDNSSCSSLEEEKFKPVVEILDDDSDCDTVTLNQLKGVLKRKRKVSSCVDLTSNDSDLMAPISSFRVKSSKKKKNHKTIVALSSNTLAAISPKSEEIQTDEDLAYPYCYPSVPIHVKTEAIEQITSEYRSIPCLSDGSSIGPDIHMDSSVNNGELDEVSDEHGVVNEVLYEALEHVESCLPDVTAITSETRSTDDQNWNIHEEHCVANEVLYGVLEHIEISPPDIMSITSETTNIADQEMLSAEEDSNIVDCSSSQECPTSLGISWQEEEDDKAQEPDTVNNPFTCSGPSDGSSLSVLGNQTCHEEGDGDELVYANCHPSVPIRVKIETVEQITSEYPSVPCFDDDSSIGTTDMHMDTGESSCELNEVSEDQCVLNEVSSDALEHKESCLPDVTPIISETTNIDYPEWNIHHLSVLSQPCLKEQQDIIRPPFHDVDREMLSAEEDSNIAEYSSLQGYSTSQSMSWQDEQGGHKVQRPDITVNDPFICLGPSDDNSMSISGDQTWQEEGGKDELKQTDIITDNSYICVGPNEDSCLVAMRDQSDCFPDPCLGPSDGGTSVIRDHSWQDEGDNDEVQQPDISQNSACICLDDSGLFSIGNQSYHVPNPCLNPNNFTPLLNDDSPTSEVEQRLHVADNITSNGFAGIQPCDGNKLSTSNLARKSQEDLRNTPVNLLSNRKVVSPTSQERFCMVMHEDETRVDNEENKCIDQRRIDDLTHGKPSTKLEELEVTVCTKEPDQSSRNEYTSNANQINTTLVKCSKGSPPKGILKSNHRTGSPPLDTNGRTSIQCCAQSAISFSQRQMQDIEALAMKLTKELNSMKSIVQDSLHSESGSLNYTTEVKTALTNATKAQKSARKWIGMMNKDCNRFCKIMELSGNKTEEHSQQDQVPEKRKRITFADEAGGELCQIKVFKKQEEEDTLLSVVM